MHRFATLASRGVRGAWLETSNMPSKFKKLVRERMTKTGESYQTAARHVREQGQARPVTLSVAEAPDDVAPAREVRSSASQRGSLQDATANMVSQDDLEADEAVAVLKVYWPIALRLERAAFDWTICHDRTPDFYAMRARLREALAAARRASTEVPQEKIACFPCGVEIEDSHRAYIESQEGYFARMFDWVERNASVLAHRMHDRVLADVWSEISDQCPIDASGGYFQIMRVERTKSLFQCGPADNASWINKVASHLGLGPDKPGRGSLRVRSSQRVIAG